VNNKLIVTGVFIALASLNIDESVAASYAVQDLNATNQYVAAGGSYTGTIDVSSNYSTNGWKMTSGTLTVRITDDGADTTSTITPGYSYGGMTNSNGTTVYDYDSPGFFGIGAFAGYETYYDRDYYYSRTITSTTEGEGASLSVGGVSDSGETGMVTTTSQVSNVSSTSHTYTYQSTWYNYLFSINSFVSKQDTQHYTDTNITNDYTGDIFLQVDFTHALLDSVNSSGGIFEYYIDSIATALGLGDFVIETVDFSYAGEVDVAAVPLPATVWLFGTALAGIGAIGRRNKKKQFAIDS
jgi:hypothetical protein